MRAAAAARSSCASRISIARACPAGAEARVLEDLAWLGLDWDEGPDRGGPFAPYRQSERARALRRRRSNGCSPTGARFPARARARTSRAPPSAPHDADEDGPRYPGTCRGAASRRGTGARARRRGGRPSIRFAGDGARIDFDDEVHGVVTADAAGIDDFVLRRADGTAAYQLAVVVDDAAMEITRVVRGDDLLPLDAAPARALRARSACRRPRSRTCRCVLTPAGERLAKRTRPEAVADLRTRGVTPAISSARWRPRRG